jgi:Lipocalin-like domain
MHAPNIIAIIAAALVSVLTSSVGPAYTAEQTLQDKLAGTWMLENLQAITWDEDDRNPFGSAPKGRMILDQNGRVTCVIIGSEHVPFLSADRLTGTAAENESALQSTQAFFGTYSVNEKDNMVVFHVERSLFPNWDGTDQSLTVTLSGDELHQIKAGPRASTGYAVWKRVKENQLSQTMTD